jgi:TetR/AcrR family acrAB operon transcriptional repressor
MSRAERTRAALLDAALAEFSRRGIRAATLEDVAACANVTRGAVYWHFPDKAALVREVFNGLVWPFDVGTDIDVYRQSENPIQLLQDVLWLQTRNCVEDIGQRRMMELILRHGGASDLPKDLLGRLERMAMLSIQSLTAVLNVPYQRGLLRRGLTPIDVARCIHATGLGILVENVHQLPHLLYRPFFLALELVLIGASTQSRGNHSLLICSSD